MDEQINKNADDRDNLLELGSDLSKSSKGNIYTLTIIGQSRAIRSSRKR